MRRYLVSELREVRCLGRGGQGEVWEVELDAPGRRLARKWVSRAAVDELELLFRLRHPHIVRLEGFGEGDQGYFLLLECLGGGHLGQVGPGLGLEQVGLFLAQALRGLAFLHSRGILHGDLKPENLLFSEDGVLKVADFGLAGRIGELERGGTPEFMAPERLSGQQAGPASDLYSLGLTFRRLLEQHPRLGVQIRAGLVAGSALSGLFNVLLSLCHVQPTRRPPDAASALQLLAEVWGDSFFLRETPAEKLAWLRTPQLAGRSETREQLFQQLSSPGVIRLRSAPQMGATRLMRELAVYAGYHLIEGSARDDVQVVSPPDLLGEMATFEGASQDIVLYDDADELVEGVRNAIINSHRWRGEKVGNKAICVVVRPGSPFDLQLEKEGVPAIILPPLVVGELETWLNQVFPHRGSTLDLARGLIQLCGGAPGRVNGVLEQLTSQGRLEVGALSRSPCPGPEVLEGLEASAIQSWGLDLGGLGVETWGPPLRELAAMCVCVPGPVSLSLARATWGHLGLTGPELYRAIEVLRELGVLALEDPLSLSGELMRRALQNYLESRWLESTRRALFLALAESRDLPGPEGILSRVRWARLGWELGEPGALAQLVATGELCLSRGLARLAEQLLSAGEGPDFDAAMRGLRTQVLMRRGRYEEALRLLSTGTDGVDVELEVNILQRQGHHRQVIERLEPLMAGNPSVQRIILLARSLGTHGQLEACFSWCRRGLELEHTPREEMALHLALGFAQLQQGDYAAAADTYTRALWLARSLADTERMMEGVRALAHIAEIQGQFDQAIPLAEEALQLARTTGNPIHMAIRAGQLAGLQLVMYHSAMSTRATFERMAQVARVSGHPAVGAAASLQLAQLFYHLGLLREAEVEATRVAETHGSSVSHHLAAVAVLAQVAVSRREWDDAWRLLQEVVEQRTREPGTHVGFRLAVVEVECLAARDSLEEACTLAKATLQVALQLHAGIEEIEARLLYATLLSRLGRQEVARSEVYQARARMVGDGILDQAWRVDAALAEVHPGADGVGEAFARSALARLETATERLEVIYQQPYLRRWDRAELRARLLSRVEQSPAIGTHQHHLERLLVINRQIGHFRDLQPLLENIVDAAVDLCGAERGYVLRSAPGEELQVAVARSGGKTLGQRRGPQFSRTLATRVLQEGIPQLITDASQEPMLAGQPSVVAQGLRSAMCAPLCVKGQVLGALYLDHHLLVRAFDREDLNLLETFCDQAAISVAQARAMEEVQAARREAEQARAHIERLNVQLEETVQLREQELVVERRLADEQRRLLASSSRFKDIIGQSEVIRRLLVQMERVCAFDFPVLITGESGTGKELVARALYAGSTRASHPFIAINCGAIPETLLESELFGVEKGAYTGATESRPGLFQLADRGVLFLDEVAETSLAMQVKLLRAIQEGEIRPVGGKRVLKVNVRIIAATNRDLLAMLAERTFREDLYYRLKVITLHLPPLRERKEDLPLLCAHLLAQMPHPSGLPYRLSQDALHLMSRYRWPGNIRELRAVLQSVVVFAESERLTARDVEPLLMVPAGVPAEGGAEPSGEVRPIDSLEREAIRAALQVTGGNKSEAARRLGISRKTLYDKLSRQQDG